MSNEVLVLATAFLGGGGLVALVLKRLWGLQDDATEAYQEGRADADHDCNDKIIKLQADFDAYRKAKASEIDRMRSALTLLVSRVDDQEVRTAVFRALWGDTGPEPAP